MRKLTPALLLTLVLVASCVEPSRPGTDEPPPDLPESPLELILPSLSGADQVAPVASYLPNPLTVQVMQGGRPQAGVPVRWASANPTARVEPLNEVSDANGYVSARFFTATTAGDQNAIAILGGQFLGIRVSALPGTPARLRSVTPATDSTTLPFLLPTRVKVEDQFGNGVPNVEVGWSMSRIDGVGYDGAVRPTNDHGIAGSFVMFTTPGQTAILTASMPSYPVVVPVMFQTSSY